MPPVRTYEFAIEQWRCGRADRSLFSNPVRSLFPTARARCPNRDKFVRSVSSARWCLTHSTSGIERKRENMSITRPTTMRAK